MIWATTKSSFISYLFIYSANKILRTHLPYSVAMRIVVHERLCGWMVFMIFVWKYLCLDIDHDTAQDKTKNENVRKWRKNANANAKYPCHGSEIVSLSQDWTKWESDTKTCSMELIVTTLSWVEFEKCKGGMMLLLLLLPFLLLLLPVLLLASNVVIHHNEIATFFSLPRTLYHTTHIKHTLTQHTQCSLRLFSSTLSLTPPLPLSHTYSIFFP